MGFDIPGQIPGRCLAFGLVLARVGGCAAQLAWPSPAGEAQLPGTSEGLQVQSRGELAVSNSVASREIVWRNQRLGLGKWPHLVLRMLKGKCSMSKWFGVGLRGE